MTAVCVDESIFIYDSVVRKVWAVKGSKPLVITTGSHKKVFEFGAVALNRTTLFRSYDNMNSRTFISFLNALKRKYRRFVLFYDGAPWHKSEEVEKYLRKNRRRIESVMFPKCSPELNPAEHAWDMGKDEILGSTVPNTFGEMRRSVSEYYRTKRFKIDVNNYLCP